MEAYTMSTREQMELLADKLPEYKLAYVVAYMQGLLMADADESADDAYCAKLLMVKEEIVTVCVTKAGNRGDIYK